MEKIMFRKLQNNIIHIMIFSSALIHRVCGSLFIYRQAVTTI